MIEEAGVVAAVHGELAEVASRRRSVCGNCEVNGACGTSLLERYFGRRQFLLTVYNPIGARPGDSVIVGVPEQALLTASFAAYMVPLMTMIAGGIVGDLAAGLLGPDFARGLSVLGGAAGLVVGFGWLGRFSRAREKDDRYRAVILRRSASIGHPVVTLQQDVQGKH